MNAPYQRFIITALVVLGWWSTASAQDNGIAAMALPGSLNASIGTVGPLEPGNTVGSARVEQGFTAWRRGPLFIVGFVDITLRRDSRGYRWNNTLPYGVGGKVVLAGDRGVLQGAVGVAGEAGLDVRRPLKRTALASYWAGWLRPDGPVQLPGSVWASSGFTTASEPDNWITTAHAEQGVAAWRRANVALVPFIGGTISADTKGRTWNNRGFVDAGAKVTTRLRGAAVEAGIAHRTSRAWQTGHTASAPAVFANLWLGWAPRLTP